MVTTECQQGRLLELDKLHSFSPVICVAATNHNMSFDILALTIGSGIIDTREWSLG